MTTYSQAVKAKFQTDGTVSGGTTPTIGHIPDLVIEVTPAQVTVYYDALVYTSTDRVTFSSPGQNDVVVDATRHQFDVGASSESIIFTNDYLTATSTTIAPSPPVPVATLAISTQPVSATDESTLRYIEFTDIFFYTRVGVGMTLVGGLDPDGTDLGLDPNIKSIGYYSDGVLNIDGAASGSPSLPTYGDTVHMAWDATNKLVWFRTGSFNDWNGDPSANPSTGIGGIPWDPGGDVLIAVDVPETDDTVTVNFGATTTAVIPWRSSTWDQDTLVWNENQFGDVSLAIFAQTYVDTGATATITITINPSNHFGQLAYIPAGATVVLGIVDSATSVAGSSLTDAVGTTYTVAAVQALGEVADHPNKGFLILYTGALAVDLPNGAALTYTKADPASHIAPSGLAVWGYSGSIQTFPTSCGHGTQPLLNSTDVPSSPKMMYLGIFGSENMDGFDAVEAELIWQETLADVGAIDHSNFPVAIVFSFTYSETGATVVHRMIVNECDWGMAMVGFPVGG